MQRPIGLAALTVLELTPPEMVSCAAEAGYDTVGLRVIPATPAEAQHDFVGDTPLVRETARRVADTGLRVLDIEIFRLRPDTHVADYRAALDTGARLGATEALVAGNDPDESRLSASFAAFCDVAREFGIAANLEPMPWTDVKTFAQGLRIVQAAARDNAGVLVDPIHFDRAGDVPMSIAAAPLSQLRYMQLCDAPRERPRDIETLLYQARSERLMPGDGALDLIGMLRAAPAGIPLSAEIPMGTLARSVPALQRARQILGKTRELLRRAEEG